MLYRGGNRWLGMQYGMTVRHPWETEGVCDPRVIWKIWDDFGISDAEMSGFWIANTPVSTSDNDVKVTTYKKPRRVLLSIGNYSDIKKTIRLKVDWKQLGLDKNNCRFVVPEISTFQPAFEWETNDSIEVVPRKGWLVLNK